MEGDPKNIAMASSVPLPEELFKKAGVTSKGNGLPKPSDDVPIIQRGKGRDTRLRKNEDPESVHLGVRYRVFQFNLWEDGEMEKYQKRMTEVGLDRFSKVAFLGREYVQDKGSWKILLEIETYTMVAD